MAGKKKIPMRQCTGCGGMKEKKSLIRVLKTDEGEILIDATGKKNGRGAYLCFSSECLEKAIRTKGLERSLKCSVPEEVYEQLREEMAKLETR
ncbi:MAG: YlxR family protein [Lachnospiraceae bacterium]|nr:YlxR family protein [Lachnospiraceae bacterium]